MQFSASSVLVQSSSGSHTAPQSDPDPNDQTASSVQFSDDSSVEFSSEIASQCDSSVEFSASSVLVQCDEFSSSVAGASLEAPLTELNKLPDGWRIVLNAVGMYVVYDPRNRAVASAATTEGALAKAVTLAGEVQQ